MRTLKLNRNTQTSYNYYVYDSQGSVRAVLKNLPIPQFSIYYQPEKKYLKY